MFYRKAMVLGYSHAVFIYTPLISYIILETYITFQNLSIYPSASISKSLLNCGDNSKIYYTEYVYRYACMGKLHMIHKDILERKGVRI
jgi:hypothetical protein